MKVVYDAIPNALFTKLKTIVESSNFPWYYYDTTAGLASKKVNDGFSFCHFPFADDKSYSPYSDFLECCFLSAIDKMEIKIKKLHRIRIGLITNLGKRITHQPHIDVDFPHKVALLYINDSDGDTILYNEKYDPFYYHNPSFNSDSFSYYRDVLKEKVTIYKTSTPKENKMILFDGLTYHSSSSPIQMERRIAINYVFEAYD